VATLLVALVKLVAQVTIIPQIRILMHAVIIVAQDIIFISLVQSYVLPVVKTASTGFSIKVVTPASLVMEYVLHVMEERKLIVIHAQTQHFISILVSVLKHVRFTPGTKHIRIKITAIIVIRDVRTVLHNIRILVLSV
jgi:hypothetical protein